MLEKLSHSQASFVTLTYSDDQLCWGRTEPSLVPSDFTNWLKRFRKDVSPTPIRFFAVGEYGGRTGRPHYHCVLFGYPHCYCYQLRSSCSVCERVRNTWGLGHVCVGEVNSKSAAYVAGYVTKKVGVGCQSGKLASFSRMSLRPGIGALSMSGVADTLGRYKMSSDVPVVLRSSGKLLPLGRYLRRRLRKQLGRPENAPEEVLEQVKSELLPLFEDLRALPSEAKRHLFKNRILESNLGYAEHLRFKTGLSSEKEQV